MPFVTINSPQAVTKFWHDVDAVQTARRRQVPPPTTTTTPTRPAPVVKMAASEQVQKRNALIAQIDTSAMALVRSGHALTMDDARSLLFKQDRSLYSDYQQLSYGRGPMFPATAPAPTAPPDTQALAVAKSLAREMREGDVYGVHVGKSELELVTTVFRDNPQLFEAHRQQSYSRG